jgi:2-polyprenyl-6-methoxyphenol hydroxylase-like FAD-dependent oxidoreductase
MPPSRGVGANTALRDASLLCRNLVAAGDGDLTAAIAAVESASAPASSTNPPV